MSSDLRHAIYVPALRWKQAEWMALRFLDEDVKRMIAPILEIPPSRFRARKGENAVNVLGRLEETAEEIGNSWGQNPFFIDLRLLDQSLILNSTSTHMLSTLAALCEIVSVQMVPIASPDFSRVDINAVSDALALSGELGLRVGMEALRSPDFEQKAHRIRRDLDIQFKNVHLIADFGFIQGNDGTHSGLMENLPLANEWGSITFLGGSFPVDLTDFSVGIHSIERYEWLAWREEIQGRKGDGGRVSRYGDYTIQHPSFEEPPRWSNPSASIRYTTKSSWLVLRGEGLRTSDLKNDQYIGHAILLKDHPNYYGPQFSYGDKYIAEIAEEQGRPGNPMTWLRAGVNHHISLVVKAIANQRGL